MLNGFPTQFYLRRGWSPFLLCRSHLVPHCRGCAGSAPAGHKGGRTSGRWADIRHRASPSCCPRAHPLCPSVSGNVLGAAKSCGSAALKPQGWPWPFGLTVHTFFLDSQPHGRCLCNSLGAAVQVLPTLKKHGKERSVDKIINTPVRDSFSLPGGRCFGTLLRVIWYVPDPLILCSSPSLTPDVYLPFLSQDRYLWSWLPSVLTSLSCNESVSFWSSLIPKHPVWSCKPLKFLHPASNTWLII